MQITPNIPANNCRPNLVVTTDTSFQSFYKLKFFKNLSDRKICLSELVGKVKALDLMPKLNNSSCLFLELKRLAQKKAIYS